MDWFLSATTILVNSVLGWSKGAWWAWALMAVNAALWIYYALDINQAGLIPSAAIGIVIDVVSGYRVWRASCAR